MCNVLPDLCISISHKLHKANNIEETRALLTGLLSGLETQKRLMVERKIIHRDSAIEDFLRARNSIPLATVIDEFNSRPETKIKLSRSDFCGSKYRHGDYEEIYYESFRTGMMYVSNLFWAFSHTGATTEDTIKLALGYYKYVVMWVDDRLSELI